MLTERQHILDAGKSDLKTQYNAQLDAYCNHLLSHADLGVQISGFHRQKERKSEPYLSNKRAIAILDYIYHKRGARHRSEGYAPLRTNVSKEEGRRVEVRIVDLTELASAK